MDEGSRAALRLSIEVALTQARRVLHAQQQRLTDATAAVDEASRHVAAMRTEEARGEVEGRALVGRDVTAGELREHRRRVEVLEARTAAGLARLDAARVFLAATATVLDEARREAGEQLARQRWLDDAARTARAEQARRVERREDED